mgnify:FL=1
MIKRRYTIIEPTDIERWFETFAADIGRSASAGNWDGARLKAEEWARGVSRRLRLPRHRVWKEFKRGLAAKWFGSPERRVFAAPWTVEALESYVTQFLGRNVRVSSFPAGIACHAESLRLLASDFDNWHTRIKGLDQNV